MNKQKSKKSNNNAQTLWSRVKPREGASNEETTASLHAVLSSEEAAAKLEQKYDEASSEGRTGDEDKKVRKEQKQSSGRDHTQNRPLKMLFFSMTIQKLRMYKKADRLEGEPQSGVTVYAAISSAQWRAGESARSGSES